MVLKAYEKVNCNCNPVRQVDYQMTEKESSKSKERKLKWWKLKKIQWYYIWELFYFWTCIVRNHKSNNFNCQKAYRSNKSEHISSNLTLLRVVSMCFEPSAMAMMKGNLEKQMFFLCDYSKERDQLKEIRRRNSHKPNIDPSKDDNSIFAFSAIFVRRRACLMFRGSVPSSFLYFSVSQSTILY